MQVKNILSTIYYNPYFSQAANISTALAIYLQTAKGIKGYPNEELAIKSFSFCFLQGGMYALSKYSPDTFTRILNVTAAYGIYLQIAKQMDETKNGLAIILKPVSFCVLQGGMFAFSKFFPKLGNIVAGIALLATFALNLKKKPEKTPRPLDQPFQVKTVFSEMKNYLRSGAFDGRVFLPYDGEAAHFLDYFEKKDVDTRFTIPEMDRDDISKPFYMHVQENHCILYAPHKKKAYKITFEDGSMIIREAKTKIEDHSLIINFSKDVKKQSYSTKEFKTFDDVRNAFFTLAG